MPTKEKIKEAKELRESNTKRCNKCGFTKPKSEFYARNNRKVGVYNYCKSCSKKNHNTRILKERYNLTKQDWELLFKSQEGKCAICGIHQDDIHISLNVDHDHYTQKVRGLLCYRCNMGIGALKDDPELLLKAIDYLLNNKN